ncbi:Protein breast cancer susceptibility 2-like B [Vitis vinifera]|uniref:Protein breast cancer susceptibility 2-like B n=1 Tax=Vitis vinifera TaxID=29760 RepID=A0A438CW04_VITVI|nr:Protein breast cancer susceptibility 2-like B [Vitis vinifera]
MTMIVKKGQKYLRYLRVLLNRSLNGRDDLGAACFIHQLSSKTRGNQAVGPAEIIEMALEGAGLSTREVTPFMRQFELVEGQAYAVAGLMPLNSDSETFTYKQEDLLPNGILYLPWQLNILILLSNLGEIPLSSEFDIAALVVYVGEVYTAAHQKKQWVFVTDGSVSELGSEEASNCLLAISFCSPSVDDSLRRSTLT